VFYYQVLATSYTTQVMAKLQRVKDQMPLSKILLEDVREFAHFMFLGEQSAFERKAADLQRDWADVVLPDLTSHVYTMLDVYP
jgi:hypothetical protein